MVGRDEVGGGVPGFDDVLASAARLQALVPDAVMVGGSAAAVHAGHRVSLDHDHVLTDLARRFEAVLDAVESDEGWATNRVTPGKVILGNLDGIETGIRQMIRRRPLEVEQVTLADGATITIPTAAEALRVKAFLVLRRNAVRDYLDSAALADHLGLDAAAAVLCDLDEYYADQVESVDGVATQVARQFAAPSPVDARLVAELDRYRGLTSRWTDWAEVRRVLAGVAVRMLDPEQ